MKRTVEIFTAGCPVCDPVMQMVNQLACESCEVKTYNLVELCDDEACLEKVKSYGGQKVVHTLLHFHG